MSFVPLHSAHFSNPWKRLTGTPWSLDYHESADWERLWTVDSGHPIRNGVEESFVLPGAEMYSEPFAIPEPDRFVIGSWFEGGEVFRSGCCYRRGNGHIFYFRPVNGTYPVYEEPVVEKVLDNAVQWAAPRTDGPVSPDNHVVEALKN